MVHRAAARPTRVSLAWHSPLLSPIPYLYRAKPRTSTTVRVSFKKMFNVLPIAFRVFSDGLQNYPQSIILNLDRTVLRISASATKTLLFTTKMLRSL